MSRLPLTDLQLQILRRLDEVSPESIDFLRLPDVPDAAITRELLYLYEHGLVAGKRRELLGAATAFVFASITAQGRDALREDGGLTAAKGVITVRLHADSIRELLAAKIAASDLPEDEKTTLLSRIRALPATALEKAVERLVEVGLDHLPGAAQWLRTLVDSFRTPGA